MCISVGKQNQDEREDIEVVLKPLADIPRLIRDGIITHSLVIRSILSVLYGVSAGIQIIGYCWVTRGKHMMINKHVMVSLSNHEFRATLGLPKDLTMTLRQAQGDISTFCRVVKDCPATCLLRLLSVSTSPLWLKRPSDSPAMNGLIRFSSWIGEDFSKGAFFVSKNPGYRDSPAPWISQSHSFHRYKRDAPDKGFFRKSRRALHSTLSMRLFSVQRRLAEKSPVSEVFNPFSRDTFSHASPFFQTLKNRFSILFYKDGGIPLPCIVFQHLPSISFNAGIWEGFFATSLRR